MVGLRKSSDWLYNDWKKRSSQGLSAATAGSVYQREVDRAAGLKPASSAGPALTASKEKNHHVWHVVQRIMHRGATNDASVTQQMEAEPENTTVYTGPPFGIIRKSLSSFDLGNGTTNVQSWPFAAIKVVYPGSPADDAGLCRGDLMIRLGGVDCLNHDHCRAVPELGKVAASRGSPIPATIENSNGERRTVTIRPKEWSGRGHFGFLLRELGTDMEG